MFLCLEDTAARADPHYEMELIGVLRPRTFHDMIYAKPRAAACQRNQAILSENSSI
jgi:hypothetical protein